MSQPEKIWSARLETHILGANENELMDVFGEYLDILYDHEQHRDGTFRVGHTRGELDQALLKSEIRLRDMRLTKAYELGYIILHQSIEQSTLPAFEIEQVRYTVS